MISAYSRRQAIEDGVLVDLCQHPTPERPELDDVRRIVRRAGFKLHVAMTATAFSDAVAPIGGELPAGETVLTRVCDVLAALKDAVRAAGRRGRDQVHFRVTVADAYGERRVVRLWCLCGPGDEGEPVLTIMLEGED